MKKENEINFQEFQELVEIASKKFENIDFARGLVKYFKTLLNFEDIKNYIDQDSKNAQCIRDGFNLRSQAKDVPSEYSYWDYAQEIGATYCTTLEQTDASLKEAS